jgi:hypothetical protein
MRWGRAAGILSLLAVAAAAALAIASYLSFKAALGARLDRAASLEAAAVRPALAARLAMELAAHRLALVSESESRAVAGAFRSTEGESALDAYRQAGGNPALVEEARKALAAERAPDATGDVAFLRAIRGLRAEAAQASVPARPEPPRSAARAGELLVGSVVAAGIASLLAYAAGRARAP